MTHMPLRLFTCWLVQFSSVIRSCRLFATPRTAARQAPLSITNSRSLLKLMSVESVMPSNHLILYCPLLLLPSIVPSIKVFSNELVPLIRWPKYWSFSFSISPFNEFSGLISFRIDYLDLLAVQGTLKSLLQYHSSKASILQRSAFLIVQLSHPYVTAGKTVALTTYFLGIHRVFKKEQDPCKNRCWVLTKYYSPCLFFMLMSVRGPCNFRKVIK